MQDLNWPYQKQNFKDLTGNDSKDHPEAFMQYVNIQVMQKHGIAIENLTAQVTALRKAINKEG